jgi:hypothetical protein
MAGQRMDLGDHRPIAQPGAVQGDHGVIVEGWAEAAAAAQPPSSQDATTIPAQPALTQPAPVSLRQAGYRG